MFDIEKLSVFINGKILLKDVTFQFDNGILCVLGVNGIGKTTLLKSLAGLHGDCKGKIVINQKPILTLTRNEIARTISFVPQVHTPYFNFTVNEMLLMGRTPYIKLFGMPGRSDYEFVEHVIAELQLGALSKKRFIELSGGEQRLVLIGMCLVQDTPVICFDEPTTSLDLRNSILILRKIKDLSVSMNKKIIISMHDLNQASMIADFVLMLYSPQMNEFGAVNNILKIEKLKKLYNLNFQTFEIGSNRYFYPIENVASGK